MRGIGSREEIVSRANQREMFRQSGHIRVDGRWKQLVEFREIRGECSRMNETLKHIGVKDDTSRSKVKKNVSRKVEIQSFGGSRDSTRYAPG